MSRSEFVRSLTIAFVVCLGSPIALADEESQGAAQKTPGKAESKSESKSDVAKKVLAPQSFFSSTVQKAVPGIDAAIVLSDEQVEKIAAARKSATQREEYVQALQKAKEKGGNKEDRQAAQQAMKAARAALEAEILQVLSEEQRALVTRINSAAEAATKEARTSHQAKIKEAKGNGEEQIRLKKETAATIAAAVREKVLSLLTEDQRTAVAQAAEKAAAKAAQKKASPKAEKPKGNESKKDAQKKKGADAPQEKEA
jgi:hypothetical protein